MNRNGIVIKNVGSKYYIELEGRIDEEFSEVEFDLTNATEVTVNFEHVTKIQSTGIREWLARITPYPNVYFIYKKCPKIVVDLINMIEGFLPANGAVESFYVPYYHEDTDEEKQVLFTYGIEFDKDNVYPPKDIKTSNGEPMEMDIVDSKYFKFLSRLK